MSIKFSCDVDMPLSMITCMKIVIFRAHRFYIAFSALLRFQGPQKGRPREDVEAGINQRRHDDEKMKNAQSERLKHKCFSMTFVPQLEVEVHRVSNANR